MTGTGSSSPAPSSTTSCRRRTRSPSCRDVEHCTPIAQDLARPEGLRRGRLSRRAGGGGQRGERRAGAARHKSFRAADAALRYRGGHSRETNGAERMIIDTHSHHVPEAMLDDLVQRRGFLPLGRAPGRGRQVPPRLRGRDADAAGHARTAGTVEPRLAWMEEQSVDHQVCAGWLDSFGYGIPSDEGLAWSRFVNEHLKRAAGDNAGFLPLATVPLQDGETAARALEEAMSEGFSGRHDRHPAQGRRRQARRPGARSVLAGGLRPRARRSTSIRCSAATTTGCTISA